VIPPGLKVKLSKRKLADALAASNRMINSTKE
jgi:hypothetical protein